MFISILLLIVIGFSCHNVKESSSDRQSISVFWPTLLFTSLFYVSLTTLMRDEMPKVSDLIESNNQKQELINLYESYYYYSEQLLDSLDAKYDWINAFDPQEYYDTKDKIQKMNR